MSFLRVQGARKVRRLLDIPFPRLMPAHRGLAAIDDRSSYRSGCWNRKAETLKPGHPIYRYVIRGL